MIADPAAVAKVITAAASHQVKHAPVILRSV
jgi:hypothetical protein